ncbi:MULTISPECIES: DUF2939 domain-containing protein [unclassified Acinetobacter]|uniref:DUF2939 domain-containing protein n=1 Tax=unclassified Acinetobacter TaxID=196816 RepID=UPI002576AF49|nr:MULTISPECIES: DUF2939 domain-containing protein [unclassified Acinetobacter]
MRKVSYFLSFSVMLSLVLWFASPYWMLYQINQAIQHNQAAKISQYIDYPRVQASLEPQIQQKIISRLGLENNHTWFGRFSERVSDQLTRQVVQTLVTPESIMVLMKGKALKEVIQLKIPHVTAVMIQETKPLNQQVSNQWLSEKDKQHVITIHPNKVEAQYISLNTFQVIVPTFSQGKTQFIFQRHYIKWQLVGIYLI